MYFLVVGKPGVSSSAPCITIWVSDPAGLLGAIFPVSSIVPTLESLRYFSKSFQLFTCSVAPVLPNKRIIFCAAWVNLVDVISELLFVTAVLPGSVSLSTFKVVKAATSAFAFVSTLFLLFWSTSSAAEFMAVCIVLYLAINSLPVWMASRNCFCFSTVIWVNLSEFT